MTVQLIEEAYSKPVVYSFPEEKDATLARQRLYRWFKAIKKNPDTPQHILEKLNQLRVRMVCKNDAWLLLVERKMSLEQFRVGGTETKSPSPFNLED